MANSLLDFVMSLVRDPDAAARYAADPAQAIADAHLTDVTSADVNNLIPMVADSLSTAAPTHRAGGPAATDGNVWTSGAATAAFDAFDAHLPTGAVPIVHQVIADVIDQPADATRSTIGDSRARRRPAAGLDPMDATYQVNDPGLDHQPVQRQPGRLADHDRLGARRTSTIRTVRRSTPASTSH